MWPSLIIPSQYPTRPSNFNHMFGRRQEWRNRTLLLDVLHICFYIGRDMLIEKETDKNQSQAGCVLPWCPSISHYHLLLGSVFQFRSSSCFLASWSLVPNLSSFPSLSLRKAIAASKRAIEILQRKLRHTCVTAFQILLCAKVICRVGRSQEK